MSRIGHRTVDAHNNGDCWPSQCPICEIEDAMTEDGVDDDE